MIQLLINEPAENILDQTSFGGLPVKETGTDTVWPKCSCGAELQYQGKIKTDIGYELIFMYNCDDWGSSPVIIVDSENLEFYHPEDSDMALRGTEYGATIFEADGDDYENAREDWDGNRRQVLGQLDGEPSWLQGDETPKCTCCNKKMRFVAQLEEGPDHKTAMNFGGGSGYLFDCKEGRTAKFLTQC
ncbi:MAG: hypothetical protein EOO45_13585 [Flavobacterium sp.]|nr:MAG: hypothetical protein EOO45_13585 [Flavobacterium sp.]